MLSPTLLVPVLLVSQCSAFCIHASSRINRWAPTAVNNRKRDSCWRQPSSSKATLLQLAAVSTPAVRGHDDDQWNTMYERLKEYQSIHGDCRVPAKYSLDPPLGRWVVNQRAKYHRTLPVEWRQRLDDIGFVPRTPRKDWDVMFQRLVDYQLQHGEDDCRVPAKYPPDPPLGHWVTNQRINYPNLSEERRQRLDDIGFVPCTPRKEWDLMFQRLVDYQLQHGDCRVPARYPPDPQLGWWAVHQRVKYPTMSVERRQRLDDIGLVLRIPMTERWDIMLERLRSYQSTNGHCAVPAKYSLDQQLAWWVANQRANYHTMSEERRQRLDNIGFVVRLRQRKKQQQELRDSHDVPTAST
jgi:Helicase associated domain